MLWTLMWNTAVIREHSINHEIDNLLKASTFVLSVFLHAHDYFYYFFSKLFAKYSQSSMAFQPRMIL